MKRNRFGRVVPDPPPDDQVYWTDKEGFTGKGTLGLPEPVRRLPHRSGTSKRRPTMFIGNEFETIMNNIGATTIVMIGCTTDGGVEATVREGFNRSYFMVIARDCVGTYTEEGHNAALKRMERFAEIVDSKKLIDIWRR